MSSVTPTNSTDSNLQAQSPTWMRVLILSCIVLCIAFAVRASGEDKKAVGMYATVDFKKIATDYKAKDEAESTFKVMQNHYAARLSRREQMALLSEDEQKSLDTLYEKANQTDKDKADIKAIEDKSKKESDQINAIQQKKDTELTDADKAKLKEVGERVRGAQTRYTAMKEDLMMQLDKFNSTQSDLLLTKIRGAIAKVAEQKGVSLVFNSEVALYAGTDITPQVVGELNKK